MPLIQKDFTPIMYTEQVKPEMPRDAVSYDYRFNEYSKFKASFVGGSATVDYEKTLLAIDITLPYLPVANEDYCYFYDYLGNGIRTDWTNITALKIETTDIYGNVDTVIYNAAITVVATVVELQYRNVGVLRCRF